MFDLCLFCQWPQHVPPPFPTPPLSPRQSEVVKCVIDDVARAHKKGNTALSPTPLPTPALLSCVANVFKGQHEGRRREGSVQRIQLAILLTFWTKQLQNVQQEYQGVTQEEEQQKGGEARPR